MLESALLKELSHAIGLPLDVTHRLVRTAPLRYKVYAIRKKNGGVRVVAQPAKAVKACQYWLQSKIENLLPVHEAAFAYKKGTSIGANANKHRGARYLLKMDFSDFFPSILEEDVNKHLLKYCGHLTRDDRKVACHILLWVQRRTPPRKLCIGAPTSPMLSNSIMFEFDEIISAKCAEMEICYTRYADDLTFSSSVKQKLVDMQNIVRETLAKIEYPRIRINEKKTVFTSAAGRQIVTGLVLTPDNEISVGRALKRKIRAMYWKSLNNELSSHDVKRLRGYISYIESIEAGFEARLLSMDKKIGI